MATSLELRLALSPTPENAPALAQLAADAMRDEDSINLDYSADSLGDLDALIGRFASSDVPLEGWASILFCLGCYLGEVVRRGGGGDWQPTSESSMAPYCRWPLVLRLSSGSHCNPIGKVFKRFELDEGENLRYFYDTFTGS